MGHRIAGPGGVIDVDRGHNEGHTGRHTGFDVEHPQRSEKKQRAAVLTTKGRE